MKQKKLLKWVLVLLFIIGICLVAYFNLNWLFMRAYGIEYDVVKLNNSKIIKTAKVFKIDSKYALCELDTNFYHFFKDSNQRREYLKPLLVMYFDKDGKMVSFHSNCYAGGFPNLDWNGNKDFDYFPPVQQQWHSVDTLIYSDFKQFLLPVANYDSNDENIDYYVLVFWDKFTGRQCKRFVKLIQDNAKLAKGNVKLIFVNKDNFFVEKQSE